MAQLSFSSASQPCLQSCQTLHDHLPQHARDNPVRFHTAARSWASAAAAIAGLGAVLAIEPDVLHLIPTSYSVVGRLGTLVLASILGTIVVRALLAALFSGERAESMSGLRTVSAWAAYVLLGLFIISGVGINLSGFLLGSAVIGVV